MFRLYVHKFQVSYRGDQHDLIEGERHDIVSLCTPCHKIALEEIATKPSESLELFEEAIETHYCDGWHNTKSTQCEITSYHQEPDEDADSLESGIDSDDFI